MTTRAVRRTVENVATRTEMACEVQQVRATIDVGGASTPHDGTVEPSAGQRLAQAILTGQQLSVTNRCQTSGANDAGE